MNATLLTEKGSRGKPAILSSEFGAAPVRSVDYCFPAAVNFNASRSKLFLVDTNTTFVIDFAHLIRNSRHFKSCPVIFVISRRRRLVASGFSFRLLIHLRLVAMKQGPPTLFRPALTNTRGFQQVFQQSRGTSAVC